MTARKPGDRGSFGAAFRAARLGYHWSEKHGAYIRMSDAGEGMTLVELVPPKADDMKARGGKFYRCWWEGDTDLLAMIPALANIVQVKQPIVLTVDDDGQLVGATP